MQAIAKNRYLERHGDVVLAERDDWVAIVIVLDPVLRSEAAHDLDGRAAHSACASVGRL